MKTFSLVLAMLVATMMLAVGAQTREPKPAFPGQTDAPAPVKPSPPVAIENVAGGLPGAWAIAFLPDGNLLVTQNAGDMRIVRRDGVVSAPVAGVPGVKAVAAQGLHDVVLDPDFARTRLVYFTYFAPPRGERPATWPIEFFYERVWT
ncbi:MAG: PQQ-dependent sugar dehydrogenase, partial [Vicinamibacterales bacterium]